MMRLWITSKRVRLFYCWYKVEPILSLTFVRISFVAGRGFSRHRSFHFIFLSIYVYVGGFFFYKRVTFSWSPVFVRSSESLSGTTMTLETCEWSGDCTTWRRTFSSVVPLSAQKQEKFPIEYSSSTWIVLSSI